MYVVDLPRNFKVHFIIMSTFYIAVVYVYHVEAKFNKLYIIWYFLHVLSKYVQGGPKKSL